MGRYLNIHLLRSYLHLCATLLPHGVFHTASVCMGIGQKQACHAPSADKGRGMGFGRKRIKMHAILCMYHVWRPIWVHQQHSSAPLGGLTRMREADACMQHAACSRMPCAILCMRLVHVKHATVSKYHAKRKIKKKSGGEGHRLACAQAKVCACDRRDAGNGQVHVFFACTSKEHATHENDPIYGGGESHRLSLTLPPHRLDRSQSGEDRWRKAKAPSPDVWLFKDDPTCCRTILEEPAVWNRRRRLVLFTSLQLPSPRTFSNLDEQVVHLRTFLSQFRATNIGARSAAWFVFAVEETF